MLDHVRLVYTFARTHLTLVISGPVWLCPLHLDCWYLVLHLHAHGPRHLREIRQVREIGTRVEGSSRQLHPDYHGTGCKLADCVSVILSYPNGRS